MFSHQFGSEKAWSYIAVGAFACLIALSTFLLIPDLLPRHSSLTAVPYVSTIHSYQDVTNQQSLSEVVNNDLITTQISNPYAFGHTQATIWLKAAIENPTDTPDWVVSLNNRHFAPAEIYQLTASGPELVYASGEGIHYSTAYQPTLPSALVRLATSGTTELVIKAHSLKTTAFDLTFETPLQAEAKHQQQLAKSLIYIGILTGLVVINLMMFSSLRRAYLAFYALQEVSIIGIILMESGLGLNYLWPQNVALNNSVGITALFLMVMSGALFTRSFFATRPGSWLDRLLLILAALAVTSIAGLYIEPLRTYILQGFAPFAGAVFFATMLSIGIYQMRLGKPYALPYLLGMALVLFLVLPVTYAAFAGVAGFAMFVVDTVLLLCVAEAIMLSIAINMRLDGMRVRHNRFNEIWIEALNERLLEVDRIQHLTQEKNRALAGSDVAMQRLSNTSHDIQHSLYSSRLHLELLRQQVQSPEVIARLEDGLNFVSEITQQLLEERSQHRSDRAELIDFDRLFAAVCEQVSPVAEAKKLKLRFTESGLTHPGSEVILRRIIENLVRNAVRYTRSGSVSLRAEVTEEAIQVSVTDTGRGMNARVVGDLIEVTNSDNLAAIEHQGFGLGLSIASVLCSQAGYRVDIHSEIKRGTTVSVYLPKPSTLSHSPAPEKAMDSPVPE